MAILVTGGAGFIGSHMVLELRDRGDDVVVLDNLSTGRRSALPDDVPLIVGDVGDAALLDRLFVDHAVDAILHFAGSIVVPESMRDPLAYYENNTCKSRTLVARAVAAGIDQFIFSSTAAVYGMPPESPVTEATPFNPISPYGTSKMMTELMLRDTAAAHDFRYVALRYFNVAGADPAGRTGQSNPGATHLIKIACEAALGSRDHLTVFGTDYPTHDGTGVRDYIHVSDLVRAHSLALDHLRAGGASETFNCGYGAGYSVLEVVDAVQRAAGRTFDVRHGDRREGDPADLVARAERIREQLGWTPAYANIDTIVSHALAWEAHMADTTAARAPARAKRPAKANVKVKARAAGSARTGTAAA